MTRGSVSIIVPSYNRAAFLPEVLESLLAQTRSPLEIVVVDDGSSDNTPAISARYTTSHPDTVRAIRHDNLGEAESVNAGWRIARGDYVGVVPSDDPQPPHWLESVAGFLDARQELIAAYPDWTMIDAIGAAVTTQQAPDFDYKRMLTECVCLPGPGALIRRALAPAGDLRSARYSHGSDFECWLRLGLDAPIAHTPLNAAQWRQHRDSMTMRLKGPALAREYQLIIDDFFGRPDLPADIAALRHRARAGVARVGAYLSADAGSSALLGYVWSWFWRAPSAFHWREAVDLVGFGKQARAVKRTLLGA